MKIGIVTLPLHNNYGGYLQNYALQVVLKKLGHDSITLNQRLRKESLKEYINTILKPNIKTLFLSLVGKSGNRTFVRLHGNKLHYKLWDRPLYFFDKYIVHTEPLNPNKGFKNVCVKYQLDALLAGSDQVWRPRYVENLSTNYLAFENKSNVKKISYAASFGTDQWEYDEKDTKACRDYVKDFSLVTVREKSAVSMCLEHFGIEAYQVLDPTMLLEKEDYVKIVEAEKEPESKGNLFCYILDNSPSKSGLVEKVASELGLTPFYVNIGESTIHYSKSYILSNVERFKNPSVTKWLRGFMDANMVIADSFHAVAFSIVFNKPFWVIGNKTRGLSRFYSILELFHLENRLLDEFEISNTFEWNQPIDWDDVNRIRNDWKVESLAILRKGLNNE